MKVLYNTNSNSFAIFLLCIVLLVSPFCLAGESFFVVRDSQTGEVLDASVMLKEVDDKSLSTQQWQAIKLGHEFKSLDKVLSEKQLQALDSKYQISSSDFMQIIDVNMAGYQPIHTLVDARSANLLTAIYLDPIKSLQKSQANKACEQATICGYVYNEDDLTPLENAVVELSNPSYRVQVKTDSDGQFLVNAEIRENSTLTVQATNHRTAIWSQLQKGTAFKLIVDLQRGHGVVEKSMHHPLSDVLTNSVDDSWLNAKRNQSPSRQPDTVQERTSGAVYLAPPANIRVGFNASGGTCCGSSCSTSQVYSLETYVQNGLDNEWISSWSLDSLKAGSIPYRSYGAWHVLNGSYPGYDICAGPCCQAYGNISYSATRNAAKATNGIMLDKNGLLARSEYSAQNNAWDDPNDGLNCSNADLSCGDGFIGSPATGWSCLADPLSAGRGCFGHGRGMSQWGTQYQALNGKSYADIVDFYYNANNNPTGNRSQYASSPVRLDGVTANTSSAVANDIISLDYEIFNAANTTIDFGTVLLGASITNGVDIYSDPINDLATVINQNGTQHVLRDFQIPASLSTGNYDVIVALYLDVNGDNAIQSSDWLLMKTTVIDMINIHTASEVIFANGFEGSL